MPGNLFGACKASAPYFAARFESDQESLRRHCLKIWSGSPLDVQNTALRPFGPDQTDVRIRIAYTVPVVASVSRVSLVGSSIGNIISTRRSASVMSSPPPIWTKVEKSESRRPPAR